MLPRFFEVLHPFMNELFCNGNSASFLKIFISKNMMCTNVLCKLHNNSSWLLTKVVPFSQPVTPVNTYLRHFGVRLFIVDIWNHFAGIFSFFPSIHESENNSCVSIAPAHPLSFLIFLTLSLREAARLFFLELFKSYIIE